MADIRILLNDRAINDLQPPASGQYRARDTQLKGFHVVVGRRSKVFAVQGDLRKDGKRVSSISVRIGDTETMSTREARATAKTYLAQISKGEHPSPKPEPIAPAATDACGRNDAPLADDYSRHDSPPHAMRGMPFRNAAHRRGCLPRARNLRRGFRAGTRGGYGRLSGSSFAAVPGNQHQPG